MSTAATRSRYNEESEDESPYRCPPLSDDHDTSDDDEDNANDSDLEAEMVLQQIKGRGKKRKKAAGRKSTWPLTALMELTDVICSSERLKRELIFTNTRTIQILRNALVFYKNLPTLQSSAFVKYLTRAIKAP